MKGYRKVAVWLLAFIVPTLFMMMTKVTGDAYVTMFDAYLSYLLAVTIGLIGGNSIEHWTDRNNGS